LPLWCKGLRPRCGTRYDFLSKLKPGGVVVLNTTYGREDLAAQLPARVKRRLAELNARLYLIDARAVADEVGLGKRINMVMQTVFFHLSGALLCYETCCKNAHLRCCAAGLDPQEGSLLEADDVTEANWTQSS
jgi:Pyruvate ferredoxin/flavodoxin oxidoreductase